MMRRTLRLEPVEQRQDHGVDGDRFAGAGGAGDEQMRHPRQIDDDGLAADRLAQRDGQLVLRGGEILAGEQFTKINCFAALVGSSMPMALRRAPPRRARRQQT